ncbi:MAG: MBL fold metallo-hydrolase [Candidatus Dormibacterales bacterium]
MLEAIDHGGPAVELRLSVRPEHFDRVAAWYVDGILVDTGGAHTVDELTRWLRGRRLEAAVIGHWHEDHSAGAATLARLGVPLFGSRATASRLRRPVHIPAYRAANWGQIEPVTLHPPEGLPLRPLRLPGHSPDQLGYLHEPSGWLFSGDVALRRRQSIAMPGEDPWAMMATLRALLDLQPAALATSHRSLIANPEPFLRDQLDYLEGVSGRIQDARARGLSPRAIVDEVFGGEPAAPGTQITWKELSSGEFSAERWVRAFLRGIG